MSSYDTYYSTLAETTIKNLNQRQIEGYYCKTAQEAIEKASSFIANQATVSFGGSATLEETGMLSFLRNHKDIHLIDRETAKDFDERQQMYHDALSSDVFFMSTNAISSDGKLINIDGTGNRLAALIYGPKNVIILAGMNKVVKNEEEAMARARFKASGINATRLNRKTPCAITGVCSDCLSPDCICNQIVITRRSAVYGRIKVILIGESFGY